MCVVLRSLDTIEDEAIMDDIVFCLSATTMSLRTDILCFNPTRRTPTCVVLRGLDTIKDEAIMDDIVFCLSATTTSLRMDILHFNPTQGNHDHSDDDCNRDNNNDKFVITVLKTSRQVVKVTLRRLHHPDDSSRRNFDGRKRHGPCIKSGKMPRHVR
ncbi:hypothetical protein EDB85DRAFT_1904654 [Lactarius pseudohatsudake]|nr:hypothetical protein EDB85DRAFT_1904654 [Lactarius pseudohatsudake]